jgi:hypothetical protein
VRRAHAAREAERRALVTPTTQLEPLTIEDHLWGMISMACPAEPAWEGAESGMASGIWHPTVTPRYTRTSCLPVTSR